MLRYLYRLEGLHAEDGNVTERGYTLQMLSKQYTVSIGQTSVSVLSNPTQIVNTMNFVSRPMRVRTFLFIFHNVLLEAISHLTLILFFFSTALQWSEEPVDTSAVASHYVPYGDISSRALRERLLLDSLDCLKEATDFEGAIEVCDQLIELYRSVAPNFPNLSRILVRILCVFRRSESPLNRCYYPSSMRSAVLLFSCDVSPTDHN